MTAMISLFMSFALAAVPVSAPARHAAFNPHMTDADHDGRVTVREFEAAVAFISARY